MGIVTRSMERRATKIVAGTLRNPPVWLREFFGGGLGNTAAGVRVDEETAMRYGAVFACVTLRADGVATLPFILYRRLQPRGKEWATEHPLFDLLYYRPNPEVTPLTLWRTGQMHKDLWGNAYMEVEWGNDGYPKALWPITPWRVKPARNKQTRQLEYKIKLPEGAGEQILRWPNILHNPGYSLDGVTGISPIGLAREAIAVGLAAEAYAGRFFSNDARPGVTLLHKGKLSDTAYGRLKENWANNHQGLSNAHRIAILEEGMDIKEVGIPPQDAQFIEQRKMQRTEISSLYRVPAHMIGDTDRSTSWGTGIEQMGLGFVTYTMRPELVGWEQAIAGTLLLPGERKTLFAKFNADELLRGDKLARYQAHAIGKQWGFESTDDILDEEDRNPLPDGKGTSYWMPVNMVEIGAAVPRPPAPSGQRHEQRAKKQILQRRHTLASAYRKLFVQASERVVKREKADVMRAAEDLLQRRGRAEFETFIDQFYRDHEEYFAKQMGPVTSSYMEAVSADALDDVGGDSSFEVAPFVAAYMTAFSARWIGSSRGQVVSVMAGALDGGEDPIAALSARFDEWLASRPDRIANWETVQESNAVARETYSGAGMRTQWSTSANACPYCSELDGATVDAGGVFVEAGSSFQPSAADEPMTTDVSVGHPPLHDGCVCGVVPG